MRILVGRLRENNFDELIVPRVQYGTTYYSLSIVSNFRISCSTLQGNVNIV